MASAVLGENSLATLLEAGPTTILEGPRTLSEAPLAIAATVSPVPIAPPTRATFGIRPQIFDDFLTPPTYSFPGTGGGPAYEPEAVFILAPTEAVEAVRGFGISTLCHTGVFGAGVRGAGGLSGLVGPPRVLPARLRDVGLPSADIDGVYGLGWRAAARRRRRVAAARCWGDFFFAGAGFRLGSSMMPAARSQDICDVGFLLGIR